MDFKLHTHAYVQNSNYRRSVPHLSCRVYKTTHVSSNQSRSLIKNDQIQFAFLVVGRDIRGVDDDDGWV